MGQPAWAQASAPVWNFRGHGCEEGKTGERRRPTCNRRFSGCPVADGRMDCVLIIAAAEATSIKDIDRCERELAGQTNVLGVVLNKCRYMENESYGYEYHG